MAGLFGVGDIQRNRFSDQREFCEHSKYEMLEATADRFGINLKKVAFNDKSKKFMADIEDKRNKWTEEERSYTEIYQAMKAPLADGGRRTSWQATKDAGKMIPGILWGAFVEPVVDAGMLVALPFVEEFGGDKAAYAYMNAVGGELKIDPVTGQQWVDQNGVLKFFNDYLHTRSVLDPSLSGWEEMRVLQWTRLLWLVRCLSSFGGRSERV